MLNMYYRIYVYHIYFKLPAYLNDFLDVYFDHQEFRFQDGDAIPGYINVLFLLCGLFCMF